MVLDVSSKESNLPGSLPEARARELIIGIKIPPARAVVEGIAGAISASAAFKP